MQCQRLYRLNFRYESIIIMNNDLVAQLIFLLPNEVGERDLRLTRSPRYLVFFSSIGSMVLIGPRKTSCFVLWVSSPTKKISSASLILFYRFFIARQFHVSLWLTPAVCEMSVCVSSSVYEFKSKALNPNCTKCDEYNTSQKKSIQRRYWFIRLKFW